ncbi:MAG: hypothetical protein SF339_29685 [Blastocatellia bacterium]|nr:hypothetical protein [Blastocatellia bacterium]
MRRSPFAGNWQPTTDNRLPTTDNRLPTTGYRQPTTGYCNLNPPPRPVAAGHRCGEGSV